MRHSAAELLLYLKSCLPPIDLTHFMVSLRMTSVPLCPMGRGPPGLRAHVPLWLQGAGSAGKKKQKEKKQAPHGPWDPSTQGPQGP